MFIIFSVGQHQVCNNVYFYKIDSFQESRNRIKIKKTTSADDVMEIKHYSNVKARNKIPMGLLKQRIDVKCDEKVANQLYFSGRKQIIVSLIY